MAKKKLITEEAGIITKSEEIANSSVRMIDIVAKIKEKQILVDSVEGEQDVLRQRSELLHRTLTKLQIEIRDLKEQLMTEAGI